MRTKHKIDIKGAQLNDLLISLGFEKRKLNKTHVIYQHDIGAVIIIRNIRWNEYINEKDFWLVRTTLFGYGLSDENTFKTTTTL